MVNDHISKTLLNIVKHTCICIYTALALLFAVYLEFLFSEVPLGWKAGVYFILFAGVPFLVAFLMCKYTTFSFAKRLITIVAILCSLLSIVFFIGGRTYMDRQQENYLQNDDEYSQAASMVLPEFLDEWGPVTGYAYFHDGWYRRSCYIEYSYEEAEFQSAVHEIEAKYEFVSKETPGYTDTNVYEFECEQTSFRIVNLEKLSQGELKYPYAFVIGIDSVNHQIVYFFVRDRENFFGKILIVSLIDEYLEMLK